jgi:TolB-like protein
LFCHQKCYISRKRLNQDSRIFRIILGILLFLSLAAHGQQQDRVAIINTLDDSDSMSISELAYLTDRLRETAANVLPKQRFGIMTTESIIAFLGSQERLVKECKAASCLADLGRKVNADYVAQGRIRKLGEVLSINFELYSTKSGVLVGSFNGSSKDVHGFAAIIDEKAPALFRKLEGEKKYLVSLSTEPPGAILNFDGESIAGCPKTPCKTELREGSVRIIAALEQYEAADTAVSVTYGGQSIEIRLSPRFGILDVNPVYLDGVGADREWTLSVNGKPHPLGEIRLYPGKYSGLLGHECYENLPFEADIGKGSHEVFDIAKHISLKKGGLSLTAERKGEPVGEQVFVNGRQVGETPFSGYVPLCADIEIGDGRESVNAGLRHNEDVMYTHKFSGKTSHFLVALALDVAGVALVSAGLVANANMKDALGRYGKIDRDPAYYKDAWADVQDSRGSRNMFYVAGVLALASGIGVHIWF